MNRRLISPLGLFAALSASSAWSATPGPVKTGEIEVFQESTPHPYPGRPVTVAEPLKAWGTTIVYPRASYIKVHLRGFELAPGDLLLVRSPDGRQAYTFEGRGKDPSGDFWATHVKGDTAILELFVTSPKGGYGFDIVEVSRGFEQPLPGDEPEAVCGATDWENAVCYTGTVYTRARAVARLHIGANSACTGWLVGCDGSLFTNNHCLERQSDVNNTDFEFMGEGALCGSSCNSWMACPGTIWGGAGTFVQTDATLDYTLLTLAGNPQNTYGYLQLRNGAVTLDEDIYIPQHPNAWGKKIAFLSTASQNGQGRCEIDSTSYSNPGCPGVVNYGYYCDTAGGSSGSPVLATSDNLAIALHHCGSCMNSAVRITDIITDLGANLPACAVPGGTCTPPAAPTGLTATAGAGAVGLSWTNVTGSQDAVRVYRGTSSGGPYGQIAQLAGNATSYNDTGVTNGTLYCYVVRGVENTNGPCESASSNESCATPCATPTFGGVQSVSDPDGCADGGVLVSWNAPSSWGGNAGTYEVIRCTAAACGGTCTTIATGVTGTSYTDNGGGNGVSYSYRVLARNSCNLTSNGGACSAFVADNAGNAPTWSGSASAADGDACAPSGITIGWPAVSAWGSPSGTYRVIRSTKAGCGNPTSTVATNLTATSYTDTTAVVGTAYYYRVEAVNSCGQVAVGSCVGPATDVADTTPPGAIGNTTGANKSGGLTLTWPDVAGEDFYDVYEAALPSAPFPAGWTLVHTAPANATSWVTTLGAGNRHFKVRARDACGNVAD